MSALRILFLSHNVAFTGGGTFFIGLQIGDHLVRRGHSVTLLASSARAVWRFRKRAINGVELVEAPGLLPSRWRYGYDPYETLRRMLWVSRQKFDIVHALESRPAVIYPALVAKHRGARLVMHWGDWFGRGGAVEMRAKPLMRTLLRPVETYYEEAFRHHADATTVISSALQARAEALGVPSDTIMRLPHVAEPENIRPLDKDASRVALGLPLDAPILGYVGALFPEDAALLVDAFARVRAVHQNTLLLLIGNSKAKVTDRDGLLRAGFVSQDDLNRYLAACDVLCLPLTDSVANRGRYPSKLGDYFCAARPTVACAVGDVASVLQTAQGGLVSEPTVTSFAEQILVLLGDAELRERLSKNARLAADTYYNWSTLSEQVELLYKRVLDTSSKREL